MTDSDQTAGFEAPDISELAPLFPGYDIESLIACGGMGAVYCAVQRSLDRTVALKILPREFTSDESFRAGFQAEAKAMARLNHPNLIGVYDFGEVSGMLYIIMEYVPGQSLFHAAHGTALDPQEASRLVIGICSGLAHAHEYGILHRDIKPANVLLDATAQPKIGDFGLARPMGRQYEEGEEIFGTPHYTAPEVITDPQSVDFRADIFSVGVVLHELLTGKLPADDPRPASAIVGCDPRFDAVIRRATNPSPQARYSSAAEIAAELQTITTTSGPKLLRTTTPASAAAPRPGPAGYRPAPPITRKSSSAKNAVIIPVLLAGLVIAGIYYLVKKTEIEEAKRAPKPKSQTVYRYQEKEPSEQASETPDPVIAPEPEPKIVESDNEPADQPTDPESLEVAAVENWNASLKTWESNQGVTRFSLASGDLWNTADEGIFRPSPWSGNGMFTLSLEQINVPHANSKAGIMLRETLGPDSRNVFLGQLGTATTIMQMRTAQGSATIEIARKAETAKFFRLQRIDDEITALVSADGETWQAFGTATLNSLPPDIHVGFAASSNTHRDREPIVGEVGDLVAVNLASAIFDVAGFLERAHSIMQERAQPIIQAFEQARRENCDTLGKTLQRLARRANTSKRTKERADTYLKSMIKEMDDTGWIPSRTHSSWSYYFYGTNADEVYAEAIEKESAAEETYEEGMEELVPIYILGLEAQIERLDVGEDPIAVQALAAEVKKAQEDPAAIVEWIAGDKAPKREDSSTRTGNSMTPR